MDFAQLARINGGFLPSRAVQVAVRLGVFDHLTEEGCSGTELAHRLGTDDRATTLLLNALTAMELVRKEGGKFFHTDISRQSLRRQSPTSYAGMILFDASLWDVWGKLEEAVRRGCPARTPDMFQSDPEETERFLMAMHSLVLARGDAGIVASTLDLGGVKTLIDIGSGPGTYPIHFCRRYPHLQATIFDLPRSLGIAEKVVREAGLAHRIDLVAGDFTVDPLPGPYDLAFLSNIIHSESAETNRRLMKKVYGCLVPGGRVVVKDHVLDDTLTQPAAGALFSLTMLLLTAEGRDYAFREVKEWLEEAGFVEAAEIPLLAPCVSSLVVGRKGQGHRT